MSEFIKEFWEKQGEVFKESHEASWGDNFAIELEIENISKYIYHNRHSMLKFSKNK